MQVSAAHVANKAMADIGGIDGVVDRSDVQRFLTSALKDGDIIAAGKATMAVGMMQKTGDSSITKDELTTMFRDEYFHADSLEKSEANAALGKFQSDVTAGATTLGLDRAIATSMTDPEPLKGVSELMKLVDGAIA